MCTKDKLIEQYHDHISSLIVFANSESMKELDMFYDNYQGMLGATDLMHKLGLITIDEWGDDRSDIFDRIYDKWRTMKDAQIQEIWDDYEQKVHEIKTEQQSLLEDMDKNRNSLIEAINHFGV